MYNKLDNFKHHKTMSHTFLACIPNSTSSPNMSSLIFPLNSLQWKKIYQNRKKKQTYSKKNRRLEVWVRCTKLQLHINARPFLLFEFKYIPLDKSQFTFHCILFCLGLAQRASEYEKLLAQWENLLVPENWMTLLEP